METGRGKTKPKKKSICYKSNLMIFFLLDFPPQFNMGL